MQVEWRPRALADIKRLYVFLVEKNPDAAKRAATAIFDGAELLTSSPRLGRPMEDDSGRRELFVSFAGGWYVLRYILENEHCVILRVWHCRENRMH